MGGHDKSKQNPSSPNTFLAKQLLLVGGQSTCLPEKSLQKVSEQKSTALGLRKTDKTEIEKEKMEWMHILLIEEKRILTVLQYASG